jgi:hypothetical protein
LPLSMPDYVALPPTSLPLSIFLVAITWELRKQCGYITVRVENSKNVHMENQVFLQLN